MLGKRELKKLLIAQGKTKEELQDKTQEELNNMLNSEQSGILDSIELETKVPEPLGINQEDVVDYLDPNWTQYVMSKFTENELIDGVPNVHGLRRVTQLLLGPIIATRVLHLNPATDPNGFGRASCIYEVLIDTADDLRSFQDVGGAYVGNTDAEYARYPEAVACTRAEARCLRKALRLQNPASEELCKTPASDDIYSPNNDSISGTQIAMIKNKSEAYKLDIAKLVKHVLGTETALESLKREEGQKVCQFINQLQTDRVDLPEEIKINIKEGE